MKLENNITIDYQKYESFLGKNSKQLFVKANFESVLFPENFILEFINNEEYFKILSSSISERAIINIVLTQNEEILLKKSYSPIAILLGIKSKENELTNEQLRNFRVLLNKVNFEKYFTKSQYKEFVLTVDLKERQADYYDLFSIIVNEDKFNAFNACKGKYKGFYKEEFVYLLRELMAYERVFLGFSLKSEFLNRYQELILKYDTEAINKYTKTNFEELDQIEIDPDFEKTILANVDDNISNLEKAIIIYLNLCKYLRFDLELALVDTKVKKHKDFTRISEITIKNNMVFSYEFSCLMAKFLAKMGINFEYNDKYLIARLGKYIIKFKSITADFNSLSLNEIELLSGVTIENRNHDTISKFNRIFDKLYKKIYQNRIDLKILKMPFKSLLTLYRTTAKKTSIAFEEKYALFLELIMKVNHNTSAIGYVYELKKILFSDSEIDANISFAIVSKEGKKKSEPVVIITVNPININLYNSNRYIYYNPPERIKIMHLRELRREFFKGYFKYIKENNDSIIGVERLQ